MLQSKQILLELNAKLAETLTSKGVTATADETTTALVNKVSDITSGDDSVLIGLIEKSLTEIIVPDGTVKIGKETFSNYHILIKVILPDSVSEISDGAFYYCNNLKSITLSKNLTLISGRAFRDCRSLAEINIISKIAKISDYAFQSCVSLEKINLPQTLSVISSVAFIGCSKLEFVTLGDGFNADDLNLSVSTLYTRETILQWLNALADRTGQTAYKLTIGATNLAKLTEQDILIATNKNWTLS